MGQPWNIRALAVLVATLLAILVLFLRVRSKGHRVRFNEDNNEYYPDKPGSSLEKSPDPLPDKKPLKSILKKNRSPKNQNP
jgi:hypothetical protein